jgi:hypothetical protein
MLTLVIRRITEDKKEKAEVQQITKRVKIKDRVKKGIIKATIKVIRVMYNLRWHKAFFISDRSTLALLKTTFTLTI